MVKNMTYLRKKIHRWTDVLVRLVGPMLPDKLFLTLLFRVRMGYWLDWKNPKTFNEKLNWLKLYNRKPEYTIMADKVKAKEYVASIIGKEHIIPTLGVWQRAEDIDFDKLPDKFVIKCNHNTGKGMYICKDKSKMDVEAVRKKLKRGLRQNFYMHYREWPYKNIPHRIIAEQLIEDPNSQELKDYKFFCFDGKPFMMYVSRDISDDAHTDFFDMDYNRLPIRMKDPNSEVMPEKPVGFEKMKELATKLCDSMPHIRVDFYDVNGHIYFGELTFFHNSGFGKVYPEEWSLKLGSMIHLN